MMPFSPEPGMWIEYEHAGGLERTVIQWARLSSDTWVVRGCSPNTSSILWHAGVVSAVWRDGTCLWRRP